MTSAAAWTEDDIPPLHGRTALVTGASSGVGLRTAQVLAQRGARVLLGCRSAKRVARTVEVVRGVASADQPPHPIVIELGDLGSVRKAADEVRAITGGPLDILVNNAGLMGVPQGVTPSGAEIHLGVNYLGPAALTWLLMPALRAAAAASGDARVVTVSSANARFGAIDFDDPDFVRRRYRYPVAYAQSKLANLVFAMELDRRLRRNGEAQISVAAHPGHVATNLGFSMARTQRNPAYKALLVAATAVSNRFVAQDVRMGALPQLMAATAAGVRGGDYYGPDDPRGHRGNPALVPLPDTAVDDEAARRLWTFTADRTGVRPDPE